MSQGIGVGVTHFIHTCFLCDIVSLYVIYVHVIAIINNTQSHLGKHSPTLCIHVHMCNRKINFSK